MSVHSRYRTGLWHPYEKPMYGVLLNPYHPLAQGLIGCWLFNEGGGNTVFDLSGYGNHGTLGGSTKPSWQVGIKGLGMYFDTAGSYINTGSDSILNPLHQISIAALIYPTGWGSGNNFGRIIQRFDGTTTAYDLYLRYTGNFRFAASGDFVQTADGSISLDNPYLLVGTYDGSNLNAYINGNLSASEPETGDIYSVDTDTVIGNNNDFNRTFAGYIFFVFLYERALSSSEVAQLYENPYCMFYHPLEAELLYAAPPAYGIVPQAMHHYRMLREV